MFNEDGDEAFEGATYRAVDDHRTMHRVVLTDVLQVEPFRRLVIELNRAELPGAAQ